MRLLAILALAFVLAAPVAVAAQRAPSGSLSIQDGRGVIEIRGQGALIGRVDRGTLQIVDISSRDRWSPRVNGVPRGRVVGTRGQNIGFFIPGGKYRVIVKGEGISISARGIGTATLEGDPDPAGLTGEYAVGDDDLLPLPDEELTITFGGVEESSASSAKTTP
jgi:hypothetical protein